MQWLGRIFFPGRVRRMRRVQQAAALLAQGKPDQAEELLEAAAPRRFVQDIAAYHFIYGRLLMERGDLDGAARHLHTAQGLGLDRASVKLNLAVVSVRQRRLSRALELLEDVAATDDAGLLEQAHLMRQVIADVQDGNISRKIAKDAQRFVRKHLTSGTRGLDATVRGLQKALAKKDLSSGDLDDAALLLGELLVEHREGTWSLGLEARDHAVVIRGFPHSPYAIIQAYREGRADEIAVP